MINEMLYMDHIYPNQCRYCGKLDSELCKLEVVDCECKNYEKDTEDKIRC